jgi:hypothetical protein
MKLWTVARTATGFQPLRLRLPRQAPPSLLQQCQAPLESTVARVLLSGKRVVLASM